MSMAPADQNRKGPDSASGPDANAAHSEVAADVSLMDGQPREGTEFIAVQPPAGTNGKSDEAELIRLAGLSRVEYDRQREAVAKTMGIRVATLDNEVEARRMRPNSPAVEGLRAGWQIVPWPDPIDGAKLMDRIVQTLTRYAILGPASAQAIALWVMHAWAHESASFSPLLALVSPVKRCGKTTVLGLLYRMVPRPLPMANISPAALYRSIEVLRPTLLIDEVDTFFDGRDELRGLLNSGHSRTSAYVVRTAGDDYEPRHYSTWAPKVLARIGQMHDTLADRAIMLQMRRKHPSEKVARISHRDERDFLILRRQAARWAIDNVSRLKEVDPEAPAGLNDRAVDNWSHLLAIADAVGGAWPERARHAALQLSASVDGEDDSRQVQLLGDIRLVLHELSVDRISSATLIARLVALEDRPWSDWRFGQPVTPAIIASLLRPFGIRPHMFRQGAETARGYQLGQFTDAFARYLPVGP